MRMLSALILFGWALAVAQLAAAGDDADAKIIQTVKPQFPLKLQQQGIVTGEAQLLIEVDANGRLADCLVTAFTQKEFAYESVRAVRAWRFVPARIGGRPASAVAPLTVLFQFNGVVARVVHDLDRAPRRETRFEYQPCAARELDAEPKLVLSVAPKFPAQLSEASVTGKVTVDFFIDETGKVRFPIAREPAEPRLAGLAIAALKLWEFEPPKRGGLAVLARASTSFAFDPQP